jgi:Glyoxalase/Bleomycin resistance protein/Dioxygenase superfamily
LRCAASTRQRPAAEGACCSPELFDVALLDHINIRASNPTRSAHFYQKLFGGNLLWIESIPPNPDTSPSMNTKNRPLMDT